ncbi:MAG: hypothetical protein M4579_005226 [Chaenotheca gracillima]|nr:MAG: hypothetical protein M4579_005226 [Chaenotheca gracillima]
MAEITAYDVTEVAHDDEKLKQELKTWTGKDASITDWQFGRTWGPFEDYSAVVIKCRMVDSEGTVRFFRANSTVVGDVDCDIKQEDKTVLVIMKPSIVAQSIAWTNVRYMK